MNPEDQQNPAFQPSGQPVNSGVESQQPPVAQQPQVVEQPSSVYLQPQPTAPPSVQPLATQNTMPQESTLGIPQQTPKNNQFLSIVIILVATLSLVGATAFLLLNYL